MALQVGELFARLSLDNKQFMAGMTEAKGLMQTTASEAVAMGRTMSRGIGLAMIAAGGFSLKFAMDAVESENLFKESMGGMADAAREWSMGLQKSLGLNGYEVRKSVGTFNVMLNSMGLATQQSFEMSKGLTMLAYDMASFYNLRPEEAFEKLRSGITGEIEPLKILGVNVNETMVQQYAWTHGIAKNGQALTENQKIMARYGSIMEQTKKAQGDMARTLDSPSNKLRVLTQQMTLLGIEIGQMLMPAFAKLVDAARRGVEVFSKLPEPVKGVALAFAAVAIITPFVRDGILGIRYAIIVVTNTLKVARAIWAATWVAMSGPVGWAIAAIVALGSVVAYTMYRNNAAVKKWVDGAYNAIKTGVGKMWDAVDGMFGGSTSKLTSAMEDGLGNIAGMFDGLTNPIGEATGALAEWKAGLDSLGTGSATALQQTISDLVNTTTTAASRMREGLKGWADDIIGELDRLRGEQKSRYEKLGQLGPAGIAAMQNVTMFGKKQWTKENLPDAAALQKVFGGLAATKDTEAAAKREVQKRVFGQITDMPGQLDSLAGKMGSADPSKVSGAIDIALANATAQQLIQQMKQLTEQIKRANQPLPSS